MLIRAKNAQIHWTDETHDGAVKIGEVEVFDRTKPWEDHEELEASAGACNADWMDGSDPRSTPEGVYAQWSLTGFVSVEAHVGALEQLAKIDGCDWAKTMAAAMRKAAGLEDAADEVR